jgi:hypothetical protein
VKIDIVSAPTVTPSRAPRRTPAQNTTSVMISKLGIDSA